MTETKFTPGPWQPHISEVRGDLCVISERAWICGEILNRVRSIPEEEARANALLIAAAPDLYEALADVLNSKEIVNDDPLVNKIIAALMKATGEAP